MGSISPGISLCRETDKQREALLCILPLIPPFPISQLAVSSKSLDHHLLERRLGPINLTMLSNAYDFIMIMLSYIFIFLGVKTSIIFFTTYITTYHIYMFQYSNTFIKFSQHSFCMIECSSATLTLHIPLPAPHTLY